LLLTLLTEALLAFVVLGRGVAAKNFGVITAVLEKAALTSLLVSMLVFVLEMDKS
jgi:hypothetical protein